MDEKSPNLPPGKLEPAAIGSASSTGASFGAPGSVDSPAPLPAEFQRLLSRSVGLPLALAFLVGAIFVWQVSMLLSANARVEHYDNIIEHATQAQMLMIDMETGLRAYVITGDPEFLEPYESAKKPLSQTLDQLGAEIIVSAAARSLEQMAEHSKAWREYAEDVKTLVGKGNEASSLVKTGRGKVLMDSFRKSVGLLTDVETGLRQQQTRTARLTAIVVLATSIGICAVVGFLAAFLVRKQLLAVAGTYSRALKVAQDREFEKTQLLANERAMRSAAEHANRMKDEFLSNLSHELRTPLNAILGWAQLLRRGMNDPHDVSEGLETIERNARMQTQLIEDLLDMSRIISGNIRIDIQRVAPVSFIEAAIRTVQPAADAKGVRIEQMLDPLAGPVSGDPARLQQIMWNLLSNAVKFTPKAGKVQVVLERVNSHLEITVADTGQGIAPEFLPYVFDRFRQADATTTRKHGGLGLGLAIVKQLVELHGGSVRVKSAGEGQGSSFIVHLPLTVIHGPANQENRVHPRTSSPEAPPIQPIRLDGIKVLVVDDQPDAQELIRRVLEGCGAKVITCSSAAEALQILESERPAVLLSDIGMPDMDGYEFLRKVRALGPDRGGQVPAVALTAFARSEDRTKALLSGFMVHVIKPVEPTELAATIAAVAGRVGDSFQK
ncbi:MAG TPA: ATP-binding protein [Pirellulales bacterium]|jgi:signal transduction histidine kinase/ActR/RegA family two-component response regulator